jgi:acetoin utilization deacetylase AcuC-like enzyme
MISAGFDAGEDDGELNLTNEDFAELTQEVQSIAHLYAKGRLISVLEGGYHIEGTAKAAFAHVKALMEIDLPRAKAIL